MLIILHFIWQKWDTERLNNCLRSCPHSRSNPEIKWWRLISKPRNVTPIWTQAFTKGEEATGVIHRLIQLFVTLPGKRNILGAVTGASVSQLWIVLSPAPGVLECVRFLVVPMTEGHACHLAWEARDTKHPTIHTTVSTFHAPCH